VSWPSPVTPGGGVPACAAGDRWIPGVGGAARASAGGVTGRGAGTSEAAASGAAVRQPTNPDSAAASARGASTPQPFSVVADCARRASLTVLDESVATAASARRGPAGPAIARTAGTAPATTRATSAQITHTERWADHQPAARWRPRSGPRLKPMRRVWGNRRSRAISVPNRTRLAEEPAPMKKQSAAFGLPVAGAEVGVLVAGPAMWTS
jgi:hypothetical protein